MSNKIKGFLILFIILILIAVTSVFSYMSGKIPDNPEGTVGNSAGNLNNKGLFCEAGDKIYFANAYDNYRLYSMNPDESEITPIGETSVQYLCHGGDYLYYYQSSSEGGSGLGYVRSISGLYRMNLKNHTVKGLSRKATGMLQLINSEIYYQYYTKEDGVSLNASSLDGKENSPVLAESVNPSCVWNNQIYFTYTEDARGLYLLDPATKSVTLHTKGNIWFPQIQDSYVYYMDADNNYRLCRFPLNESNPTAEILTTDRVDTFLVYGDYIYYQKNDAQAPALKRMALDGSNAEIVAEGNYENINGVSGNIYFNAFGADTPVYHTPAFSAIQVSEFEGAKAAALENIENR